MVLVTRVTAATVQHSRGNTRLLSSFFSYMRFTGRGPRTRFHHAGRWHVRSRIERFVEPALLLLLSEQPAHGYELVEPVSQLVPDERVDMGNLYRVLRALEEDGLVRSEWDAAAPGPAKRRYELTPQGRELLRAWVKALQQTQLVVSRFLERYERR
jgi:PadR family transcriptional regulator PadR